jgi:hypothetical protein
VTPLSSGMQSPRDPLRRVRGGRLACGSGLARSGDHRGDLLPWFGSFHATPRGSCSDLQSIEPSTVAARVASRLHLRPWQCGTLACSRRRSPRPGIGRHRSSHGLVPSLRDQQSETGPSADPVDADRSLLGRPPMRFVAPSAHLPWRVHLPEPDPWIVLRPTHHAAPTCHPEVAIPRRDDSGGPPPTARRPTSRLP